MKKLIINADDFGYRAPINKGIVFAHKNGLVTSASLFVGREATDEAVKLAKENPTLGLGLHVDLDKFFKIDHEKGFVIGWEEPNPSLDEVEAEIRRQLDKFKSFGLTADHVDSHHHAHLNAQVFPIVCRVAKDNNIPFVRFSKSFYPEKSECEKIIGVLKDCNLKFTDRFIEGWYWGNIDEDYTLAELMTHPGYGEIWRETELANCCQRNLLDYFKEQKIELLRFCDIT